MKNICVSAIWNFAGFCGRFATARLNYQVQRALYSRLKVGRNAYVLVALLIPVAIFSGCSSEPDTMFLKVPSTLSGVTFSNDLINTPDFSIQNYLYFYDGGGVAVGDINNDGLPDLFFSANMKPNKLYLNEGDFRFRDITESAGIVHQPESWSTGVTMADVNADGLLDIYISHVSYLTKRGRNQLFINQGDTTFVEKAADYGLDFEGYSTHAAFFDANMDGYLDMYLLNHSFHSENTYGEVSSLRSVSDPKAGDRLYLFDGTRFTDATAASGIYSSALGYGLGLAVSDINLDGYPDLYIGNDFHEDDYLYINRGDGTFDEKLYEMMGHTSNSSMGNDIADLDNDGLPEIFSLDMMPWDRLTFARSGSADPVPVYETKRSFGFGEKNNRNTLQHHQGFDSDGVPKFSEIAFARGVARTDWSWSVLMADFTNNGLNDLFVTNGIPGRPNDLDYISALRSMRQSLSGDELLEKQAELIPFMTDSKTPDQAFENRGAMQFENRSSAWGIAEPGYSNGAAYADLNNDGYLDLVVNRINSEAVIYRNRGAQTDSEDTGAYVQIELNGEGGNRYGLGTKVYAFSGNQIQMREQSPVRGFQSSVDPRIHMGFSPSLRPDSLLVIWPDKRYQVVKDLTLNSTLHLHQKDASGTFDYETFKSTLRLYALKDMIKDSPDRMIPEFIPLSDERLPDYKHEENSYEDFEQEPLLPFRLSVRGPASAVGDVNGDGLDDLYLGGAKGQSGILFIQNQDGGFERLDGGTTRHSLTRDKDKEDIDAVFMNADDGGAVDLVVVSGGFQFDGDPSSLTDRIYFQHGEGQFSASLNSLPPVGSNGSSVAASDINQDGYEDLFIGGDTAPWSYGVASESKILLNNGRGVFRLATDEIAPGLSTHGIITDAVWVHSGEVNKSESGAMLEMEEHQPEKRTGSRPELVLAGEWMPPSVYSWKDSVLTEVTKERGLSDYKGLWQSIHVADVTGNGYPDIIAGNIGLNSRMTASMDAPLRLYTGDFAETGQGIPMVTMMDRGEEFPFDQTDEILQSVPVLRERIQSYDAFAKKPFHQLFERSVIDSALQKSVTELRSMLFLNEGGHYRAVPLPDDAQTFPVQAIVSKDLNGDGLPELILGGNRFDLKPSYGGRQDAGRGLLLLNRGDGMFDAVPPHVSRLFAEGEIRDMHLLQTSEGRPRLLMVRNNDTVRMFDIISIQK